MISYQRAREWQDVHSQLTEICRQLRLSAGRPAPAPDRPLAAKVAVPAGGAAVVAPLRGAAPRSLRTAVHQALLAGLVTQVGIREGERTDYRAPHNARFAIWPGSALAKRLPRWIMAAELVETGRLWARVVAPVQPRWVERAAAHLLEWSYGEPEWDAERGKAVVFGRATFYGVPVVTSRAFDFSQVDPAVSREMFIHHALVAGDWEAAPSFVESNRKALDGLGALAHRFRRQELLVGEEELFDFYGSRLGEEVTSGEAFRYWWRRQRPDFLDLRPEDLIGPGGLLPDIAAYPDTWELMGAPALALRYKWEPGSEDDGVNVEVPLAALDRLAAEGLEWQVPGLREELVLALLRSLPKEVRRRLVPLPERAAEFLARAGPADGPLPAVLARWLAAAAGADISPADFNWEKLPPYLRPTFHLVGEDGRLFASGKDLGELWSCVQPMLGRALGEAARAGSLERSGLKTWDFGELPKVFEPVWQGCRLKGYPALVDDGDSVSVRVLTDGAAQSGAMVAGTRRLLLLSLSSQQQRLDRFERLLDNPTRLAVSTGPQPAYRSVRELVEDVAAGAVDQIVEAQGGPAWERGEFWELRSAVVAQFDPVVSKAVLAAGRLFRESQDVRRWLDDLSERAANLPKPAPLQLALADIDRQLVYLAGPRFVSRAGLGRLADIERYLRAMDAASRPCSVTLGETSP